MYLIVPLENKHKLAGTKFVIQMLMTLCAAPVIDAVEAVTDEWSPWSVCSITCGEGWQSRTRLCATSSYSTQCTGPLRENRPCNNTAVCPGEYLLHPSYMCDTEWDGYIQYVRLKVRHMHVKCWNPLSSYTL